MVPSFAGFGEIRFAKNSLENGHKACRSVGRSQGEGKPENRTIRKAARAARKILEVLVRISQSLPRLTQGPKQAPLGYIAKMAIKLAAGSEIARRGQTGKPDHR